MYNTTAITHNKHWPRQTAPASTMRPLAEESLSGHTRRKGRPYLPPCRCLLPFVSVCRCLSLFAGAAVAVLAGGVVADVAVAVAIFAHVIVMLSFLSCAFYCQCCCCYC